MASHCAFGDAGCPCGADGDAPLDEHDLSFEGRHVLANGCVCQCGADLPFQGERDARGLCTDEGRACTDGNGTAQVRACY
jgi:hypothetical protein